MKSVTPHVQPSSRERTRAVRPLLCPYGYDKGFWSDAQEFSSGVLELNRFGRFRFVGVYACVIHVCMLSLLRRLCVGACMFTSPFAGAVRLGESIEGICCRTWP